MENGPVIGVEGSSVLKQRTGIGLYTYQLLKHLVELDRETSYRVFTNSLKDTLQETFLDNSPNFTHIHSRIPGKVLLKSWQWFRAPSIEHFLGEVDLFHSTNNNPIPQRTGKRLLTVYDLYFLHKPDRTERYGGQYFHRVLPRYIREWDHVITISEAMKHEITDMLAVPPEKITIVPCGLDEQYWQPLSEQEKKSLDLPDKFVLAVGTLEPRKNYPTLLKAFRSFLDQGHQDYYLVISGIAGCGADEVHEVIADLNLDKQVLLLGYLTKDQLRLCYHRASLFVMVSEYEGFGIPVLEAMACGTPVIASNTTSFPEVVGQAGILVDPFEVESIAGNMHELVRDEARSAEFVKLGYENARRYTWKEVAERTLDVYRALTGRKNGMME